MGKETPEEKRRWIQGKASVIPLPLRQKTAQKYISQRESVPKGVPTSGNVLVGLDIVSKAEKEALMEAQAAGRILNHLEHPETIQLTNELFLKDANGSLCEARSYLDKPFSTKIQRLEHLSAILAGYQVIQKPYRDIGKNCIDTLGLSFTDLAPAQDELKKIAISTLYQVSKKLSSVAPPVASEIGELAKSYASGKDIKNTSTQKISETMEEILPTLFLWHAPHLNKSKVNPCEDSYTAAEKSLVEGLIKKRIQQIQNDPYTFSNVRDQQQK